jgi:hypothetical protein
MQGLSVACPSFSLPAKENEAKERPPSTWPSASLAKRLPAAVPQTRPNKLGLRQRGHLIRIQSLPSAALNGQERVDPVMRETKTKKRSIWSLRQ